MSFWFILYLYITWNIIWQIPLLDKTTHHRKKSKRVRPVRKRFPSRALGQGLHPNKYQKSAKCREVVPQKVPKSWSQEFGAPSPVHLVPLTARPQLFAVLLELPSTHACAMSQAVPGCPPREMVSRILQLRVCFKTYAIGLLISPITATMLQLENKWK